MIVQFSRSAKRRRTPGTRASGLSKLNSMSQIDDLAPGPVDIRYRVTLELDGMPSWRSPALHVLELP
jgi:hypothetical protein